MGRHAILNLVHETLPSNERARSVPSVNTPSVTKEADSTAALVQREADRCVKCGLCLPHCPTYALDREEAESPRGRIALLHAVASGYAEPDGDVRRAIDHCLSCRACERVCPADVRYGTLFDAGQALLAESEPTRGRHARRRASLLHRPRLRRWCMRGLYLLQRTGLVALARMLLRRTRFGVPLRRLTALPWPRRPHPGCAPAQSEVGLFSGCLGDSADRAAVEGAQALLSAAGWSWSVPPRQDCCGALEQHGGDAAGARRATRNNASVFAPFAHIVPLASGCGAWLQDADHTQVSTAEETPFGGRIRSLWSLLKERADTLTLAPRPQRVAVWLACTQRNVVRDEQPMLDVLRKVPDASVQLLDHQSGCCGAAGLHFIEEAERADRLIAPIIDAIRAQLPEVVLCANVGCRLHLAAALREAGLRVSVQHPAQWLADALR